MPNVKSPYRKLQAQATRQRITTAARRLFARDGYATTTIDAIAREAGVAVPTVYATFGSKRGILLSLLETMEAEGGIEQLQQQLAAAAAEPARQIREWAAFSRRFFQRGLDLLEIARGAGTADPDIRALGRQGDRRRRQEAQARVRDWAELDVLRAGLQKDEAADILWTLLSPDVFRLLVVECKWSGARYERWLVGQLEGLLGTPGGKAERVADAN
jgi:TetR/AcrR family transcriptional regulator, regulator of autoinduction and epiphytic fitness